MLEIGKKAPDFNCNNQDGQKISLDSFLGEKLILFFYPKANTPGCTQEVCNLSDNYNLLKNKGFRILGISVDNESKQKKFKEKYSLPFDLLADIDKEIVEKYEVWGRKKFIGKEYDGIFRTTFIIDENGYIEDIIKDVLVKDHSNQILEKYR